MSPNLSSPLDSNMRLDPLLLPPPALQDEEETYTTEPKAHQEEQQQQKQQLAPPTLKRKIIQVEPYQNTKKQQRTLKPKNPLSSASSASPTYPTPTTTIAAAAKKLNRKTAHSEIEKKRRCKINKEFETLKQLVPACRSQMTKENNNGNNLHKLVILKETVEYIRYLESIVNVKNSSMVPQIGRLPPSPASSISLQGGLDKPSNMFLVSPNFTQPITPQLSNQHQDLEHIQKPISIRSEIQDSQISPELRTLDVSPRIKVSDLIS